MDKPDWANILSGCVVLAALNEGGQKVIREKESYDLYKRAGGYVREVIKGQLSSLGMEEKEAGFIVWATTEFVGTARDDIRALTGKPLL
jgi:hypothetical protein